MQLNQYPSRIPIAWAANGSRNVIPWTSQIGVTPGRASLPDGFPPLTMTPLEAGGIPPSGPDMNGILNLISGQALWFNIGGPVIWDATFAQAIGGYPQGAQVIGAGFGQYFVSSVDNNLAPLSDPSWVPIPPYRSGFAVFTQSGNFTVPYGVYRIIATVQAAGGGGSNCAYSGAGTAQSGGGGGGGGTAICVCVVSPGQVIPVTVPGPSAAQATGGTASFGPFCSATGGKGANFLAATTSPGAAPGNGLGGNVINMQGGWGSDGQNGTTVYAGNGGSSFYGGGARSFAFNNSTPPAPGYGGGGGGVNTTDTSGANLNGGPGGAGIVTLGY